MRFKREDAAYAAATTVAATLVAFLVAGNFGLVPTPLAPAGQDDRSPVGVPVLQTGSQTPGDGQGGLAAADDNDLIPDINSPRSSREPPTDSRPPSVTIATTDGSIVVALSEDAFQGSATDDASGIDRVIVTYQGTLGGTSTAEAALACSSPRNCSWSANAPSLLDIYQVSAEAFDREGRSAESDTVSVIVVDASPGSASSSSDKPLETTIEGLAKTVQGTVEMLGGAVGGLLGGR